MEINRKIIHIAKTAIKINNDLNDLPNIVVKITQWIDLILEYGIILNENELFENFNLDDTFFTQEMRLASLGREYTKWKISAIDLHDFGETWTFEKLVITSNTGLIDWYCKKLKISEDDYIKVCNNENIQILGVFYHRLKIIVENIYRVLNFLSGSKIYNYFDMSCIDKILSKQDSKLKKTPIYELSQKIKIYENSLDKLMEYYIYIERATEIAQLALFNFIRDKSFL